MTEIILYSILALAIILSALGVILTRNAVAAVLLLVTNFLVVAIIYLILGAPFIALSQITVYAGAIMILFLFVIMMLGAERLLTDERRQYIRVEALVLAAVFLGLVVVLIVRFLMKLPPMPEHLSNFGDPAALGALLFTRYAMPVIAISVLLLVAAVGTVILTKHDSAKKPVKEDKS